MSNMATVQGDQATQSTTQQQRVEQFKQEIADMRLRDPATARERMLLRAGVVLMIAGVVTAVVSYFGSNGTENPLAQRDFIVVALIGVTVTILGAALFLRYSIAQFLRFWLARLSYEQQHQTDRIVEKLK
jgi:hypothetical protein